MARSSRVRRTVAVVAVAAGLASGGCLPRAVPLYGSPVSGGARHAPLAAFEVSWWKRLVDETPWEYAAREPASPAVNPDTGRIVTLTRDGVVRCLSPEGVEEWRFLTKHPFSAGAAFHEGVVLVPGGDGVLYALDARTGALRWKHETAESLATVPLIVGDRAVVVSHNDTVYAVGLADGKRAWQYRRDLPSGFTIRGVSRPTERDGKLYLGFADGHLVALDAADGTERWARALSAGGSQFLDVDTSPVVDDAGRLMVASYQAGIFALDAESGDVRWTSQTPGMTSLVTRGEVLFAAGDAQVVALHTENGTKLWTLPLGERSASAPVLARGGVLLVPTQRALLFVDAVKGTPKLEWNPGEGVTATPQVARGHVYALSNLGVLYSLRLAGGVAAK